MAAATAAALALVLLCPLVAPGEVTFRCSFDDGTLCGDHQFMGINVTSATTDHLGENTPFTGHFHDGRFQFEGSKTTGVHSTGHLDYTFNVSMFEFEMLFDLSFGGYNDGYEVESAGFAIHFGSAANCNDLVSLSTNIDDLHCGSDPGWTLMIHDCVNLDEARRGPSCLPPSGSNPNPARYYVARITGGGSSTSDVTQSYNDAIGFPQYWKEDAMRTANLTVTSEHVLFGYNNGDIQLQWDLPTRDYFSSDKGVSPGWVLRMVAANNGLRGGVPGAREFIHHKIDNLNMTIKTDTTAPTTSINVFLSSGSNWAQHGGQFYDGSQGSLDFRIPVSVPTEDARGVYFYCFTDMTAAEAAGNLTAKLNAGTAWAEDRGNMQKQEPSSALLESSSAWTFSMAFHYTGMFSAFLDGTPDQGEHQMVVYGVDKYGNIESDPTVFAWMFDTERPTLALSSDGPTEGVKRWGPNATFTFTAADVVASASNDLSWVDIPRGVQTLCHLSCYPKLPGTVNTADSNQGINAPVVDPDQQLGKETGNPAPLHETAYCTSPFTTPDLPDGLCTFSVGAVDLAENHATSVPSRTWDVEIPPYVNLTIHAAAADENVCMFGNYSDDGTICVYNVSDVVESAGKTDRLVISAIFTEMGIVGFEWTDLSTSTPLAVTPVVSNTHNQTFRMEYHGVPDGRYELHVPAAVAVDDVGQDNYMSPIIAHTVDTTLPTMQDVSMRSNNSISAQHARPGDTITFTFTASETIHNLMTTVNSNDVTAMLATDSTRTSTVTLVTDTSYPEGTVEFRISGFTDSVGNVGNDVIPASINSSHTVFFDTTKPTIATFLLYSDSNSPWHCSVGSTITAAVTFAEDVDPLMPPAASLTVHRGFAQSASITLNLAAVSGSSREFVASQVLTEQEFGTTVSGQSVDAVTATVSGFRDMAGNIGDPDSQSTSYTTLTVNTRLDGVNLAAFNDPVFRDAYIRAVASSALGCVTPDCLARVTISQTLPYTSRKKTATAGVQVSVIIRTIDESSANQALTNINNGTDFQNALTTELSSSSVTTTPAAVTVGDSAVSAPTATSSGSVAVVVDTVAPTLSTFALTPNQPYVHPGDTMTVTLTASEPINPPTITIHGHQLLPSVSTGTTFTASHTFTTSDADGEILVSVSDLVDLAGNVQAGSGLASYSTGSIFDITPPSVGVTLYGSDGAVIPSSSTLPLPNGTHVYSNSAEVQFYITISEAPLNPGSFTLEDFIGISASCDPTWNSQYTRGLQYEYTIKCRSSDGNVVGITVPKPGAMIQDRAGNNMTGGAITYNFRSDTSAPVSQALVLPLQSSDLTFGNNMCPGGSNTPCCSGGSISPCVPPRTGHDHADLTTSHYDPGNSPAASGVVAVVCEMVYQPTAASEVPLPSPTPSMTACTSTTHFLSLVAAQTGQGVACTIPCFGLGQLALTGLPDGSYQFTTYAVDGAGNQATPWVQGWTVSNCDWSTYCTSWKYYCADSAGYSWPSSDPTWPTCTECNVFNEQLYDAECWDVYIDCSSLPACSGTSVPSNCVDPQWVNSYRTDDNLYRNLQNYPSGNRARSAAVLHNEIMGALRAIPGTLNADVQGRVTDATGLEHNHTSDHSSTSDYKPGCAVPSHSASPSSSASPSNTASSSVTASNSVSASQSSSTSPTAEVTPSSPVSPTVSPSQGSQQWLVSSNVRVSNEQPYGSVLQNGTITFTGDLLRYSDIDVHLTCECPASVKDTWAGYDGAAFSKDADTDADAATPVTVLPTLCQPGCDWVMTSAARILFPRGFTGFQSWRVVNGGGNLNKSLLATVNTEWQETRPNICKWPLLPSSANCSLTNLPLTEYEAENTIMMQIREPAMANDGAAPLMTCWEDVTRVPHCMVPQYQSTLEKFEKFPLIRGQDFSMSEMWRRMAAATSLLTIFVCVMLVITFVSCCDALKACKEKKVYVLDTEGLHTVMKVHSRLDVHTNKQLANSVKKMSKQQLVHESRQRMKVKKLDHIKVKKGVLGSSDKISGDELHRMNTMRLRKELTRGKLKADKSMARVDICSKETGKVVLESVMLVDVAEEFGEELSTIRHHAKKGSPLTAKAPFSPSFLIKALQGRRPDEQTHNDLAKALMKAAPEQFTQTEFANLSLQQLREKLPDFVDRIRGYMHHDARREFVLKHLAMHDRNELSRKHYIFIFVLVLWRIARMIILTISFFVLVFTTITKAHFDTWKQHPEFRANLTGQLTDLSRIIENNYNADIARMRVDYNWQRAECTQANARLESEYTVAELAVQQYHDDQIAVRQGTRQASVTVLTRLSSTRACGLNSATGSASYEEDQLGCTVANVSVGQVPVSTCWNYSQFEPSEWEVVLRNECEARRAVSNSSCVGFSIDTTNQHYYIMRTFGTPQVDVFNQGSCHAYVTTAIQYGSTGAAVVDYTDYRASVNATLTMANDILGSLRDGDGPVYLTMDYGASEFGFDGVYQANYYRQPTGASGWDVYALYGCPNCPTWFSEPSFPESSEANYSHSNDTYGIADAAANVTVGVDDELLAQVESAYSEAYFPDLVEFPTMDLDVWTILIPGQLAAFILMIDLVMTFYRFVMMIGMVSRYMRGYDRMVPLTQLGLVKNLSYYKDKCGGLFYRCMACIYRRLANMDQVVAHLMMRIFQLFFVAAAACIILAAYWFVDNLIQMEVFEKTQMFASLTAGPAAQRVIRNEQIAIAAYGHNSIILAETAVGFQVKATELSGRQRTFNEREITRIQQFNAGDCAPRQESLEKPFTLVTCLQNATFGAVTGGCPLVSTYDDLSSGGSFEFELQNPDTTAGYGLPDYFLIDELSLEWSWDPPATSWFETRETQTCKDVGSTVVTTRNTLLHGTSTPMAGANTLMVRNVQCPSGDPSCDLTLRQELSNTAAVANGLVAEGAFQCIDTKITASAQSVPAAAGPSAPSNPVALNAAGDDFAGNIRVLSSADVATYNAEASQMQALGYTIELLTEDPATGLMNVSWSGRFSVPIQAIKQGISCTTTGQQCDSVQCGNLGSTSARCCNPAQTIISHFGSTEQACLYEGVGTSCDSSNPVSDYFKGQYDCSAQSMSRVALDLDEVDLGSTNVAAKRIRVTIDPGALRANKYFKLLSVGATGHQDASNWVCDEVQWRKLAYQPDDDTVGNCSRLMPIHGEMMRIFAVDEWTEAIRIGYEPFVEAIRNICLAPFYILFVCVCIILVVEIFLDLVEFVLIKADFVRQNIFAKVPVAIAKAELEDKIKNATDVNRASIKHQKNQGKDLISSATIAEDEHKPQRHPLKGGFHGIELSTIKGSEAGLQEVPSSFEVDVGSQSGAKGGLEKPSMDALRSDSNFSSYGPAATQFYKARQDSIVDKKEKKKRLSEEGERRKSLSPEKPVQLRTDRTDRTEEDGANRTLDEEEIKRDQEETSKARTSTTETGALTEEQMRASSDWQEFSTGDGRIYFFNSKTKESVWAN